jgi:hypothetical protein
MDTRKVLGFALIVGGAGAACAAVYFATKKAAPSKLLGRGTVDIAIKDAIETEDGYRLTHYRKDNLPIGERVAILQELTAKGVKTPAMRKLALEMTRKCPERDGECEAKAIAGWIKKNIRYTGDVGPHALWAGGPVEGIDLFQRADRTIEFGGGDCDDHAILACTSALLNGLSCKYRVTSPSKKKGDNFTHIYAMIGLPKTRPSKYVAVDTTLPGRRHWNVEAPYAKRLDFVA